jgi:heme a synthase
MQSNALDTHVLSAAPPLRHGTERQGATRARYVGIWLWCVAALVFAMVLVGGATRLTESGLSIVEWQPVTGVVPPLSAAQWQSAFAQYQTIPQYQRVNHGMSLDEFKTIYWWEWSHRLLGRLIGVVFLLPFLWFLWRGWVDRRLAAAFAGIFALGAIQGAVGWWMVASGLTGHVNVSQYRLAFHLTLACIIYAVLVWTADRVIAPARAARTQPDAELAPDDACSTAHKPLPRRLTLTAGALLALVLGQIYLGALVAGLRAGLIYNTWPLIDGTLIPPAKDLFFGTPLWANFFENTLTVQFDHRMLAYTVGALALLHAIDVRRNDRGGRIAGSAGLLVVAVLAQMMIGVLILLRGAPIDLALIHQATALVVLTAAALNAARAFATGSAERIPPYRSPEREVPRIMFPPAPASGRR